MSEEMKLCPFCGGEAIYGKSEASGRVRAVCVDCLASTDWLAGTDEAAAAWNSRAERTCRVESSHEVEGDGCYTYFEYELSCGDLFTWWDSCPPVFCPYCGCGVITDAD